MKLLQYFFKSEAFGGIILILAAVFAMFLANISSTQEMYQTFLNTPVEFRIGSLNIKKNIFQCINDALMTVFFLLAGLEVKRELLEGSLSNRKSAAFPAIAALGGMLVPELIYLTLNYHDPVARAGWAIPLATDIAFSFSVLMLLGKRVPTSLKTFLMTLAIIDDLVSIIIIALFYSTGLSVPSMNLALGIFGVLIFLNICNVRRTGIYILIGTILWITMLKSGIHTTLSGVIVGFLIPLKQETNLCPARQLQNSLQPWVSFTILPLFAFANAGIPLQDVTLNAIMERLPLSIIAGLFIGKPLGISLFSWIALKFKLASLPPGVTNCQIIGIGVLCGVGFTMSIFIANLSFDALAPQLVILAKLGILIASILAGLTGYIFLKSKLIKNEKNSLI